MNNRTNNFDLIRLAAAMQVLIGHSIEHLHIQSPTLLIVWRILSHLPGVPIFFVLSGFLISRSFERNSSLVDYAWNRSTRIFPALWVCFIVSFASVIALGYRPQFDSSEFLLWAACQLTCLQIYNPEFMREYGVGVLNGSLWTIPVELQFYIAIPIVYWLLKLLKSRNNFRLLFLIAIAFGIRRIVMTDPFPYDMVNTIARYSAVPYFYIFLIGVALQRNFAWIEPYVRGKAIHWLVGLVVMNLILAKLGFRCRGNEVNPISAILLAFLTVSLGYTIPTLGTKILRGNDISYGLYVYHMPVVNGMRYSGITSSSWCLVIVSGLTTALAFASWMIIERPALRFKRYRNKQT